MLDVRQSIGGQLGINKYMLAPLERRATIFQPDSQSNKVKNTSLQGSWFAGDSL